MAPGAPRSVLLDVTRLVSRVGGGPATGIDRVERAMLRALLDRGAVLHGLCRTAGGFALLDEAGLHALALRLEGIEPWGRVDVAGHLSFRLPAPRRAAESGVRRLACGQARASGLGALLCASLEPGAVYLNLGHSNLSDAVFGAVRAVSSSRVAVMIHDVIPLRLPWTQRPGATARFGEKLAAVSRHADTVYCPSHAEGAHLAQALGTLARTPEIVVAPLGIDDVVPDPETLALEGLPSGPYFVAVGTMEPRKNLGLLLDLWEHLARTGPTGALPGLCLVGRRGWEERSFFSRLDVLKARIPEIREYPGLTDGGRAALVAGARALLFPSLAEGYGLPPLEALSVGVTPVCAPLPVYRETMGDAAVYADPNDMYHWARSVEALKTTQARVARTWRPPSWDDHVNKVLATIA